MGRKKRAPGKDATGCSPAGTGEQGEGATRRSEEKLRSILENSVDILYRQNVHTGVYDYISPSVTRTLGYTPEEVMALGVEREKAFFHPEDLPGLLAFRDELLAANPAGRGSIEREFRIRHKNGQYRWLHGNYLLTRDAGGEADFIVGALRDVTDDKHAREALRTSERRFRELIEQSPIGMVIFDPEGRPTYVNPAHRQVIDADPAELELMKAYYNIFEDQQLADSGLMPLIKRGFAGEAVELPAVLYDPKKIDPRAPADREPLWLSGFVFPLKDACGGVREVVVTFQDVTESKRAEEALRSAREDWQRAFDAMPDLVAIVDNEYRTVRVNKAMADTLGIAPEDAVGKHCYRYVHGTDEPPPDCPHAKLCLDGNEHTAEVYEESLGGHFLITATPLPEPGSPPTRSVHVARNITDRKSAEKALRESEQKYRDLFENANDLIQSVNSEGRFLYVNRKWRQMLEYTSEDLEQISLWDVLREDQIPHCTEVFKAVCSGRTVDRVETVFVSKSGKEIFVEGTANGFFKDGHFIATRGIFRDITERKRAEEALRKAQERYRELFEGAVEGILVAQGERICFSNPAWQKMIGHDEETLTSDGFVQFIHPDDRELVLDRYRRRISGEDVPTGYDFRIVAADNDVRWVRLRSSVIDWEGDKATLNFLTDITEHKQAEEALRKSEESLTEAQAIAHLGSWEWDIATDEVLWSDETYRIFGLSQDVRPCADVVQALVHPDDREAFDPPLGILPDGPLPESIEYRTVRDDGEVRFLQSRGEVIRDESGTPVRLVGTVQDITDRKRAEQERKKLEAQIQQTQKLESLGVLAGGVAHDFNNLLMGVLGNADLALMDLSPVSPVRQHIESIQSASQRLADLATQMLAYSGRGHFVMGPLDLGRLVSEMGHLLGASISKKTALKYELAPDIPAIHADATQVRQIVMNLVINASEALRDDAGVVAVSTNVIACDREYLGKSYLREEHPEGEYVYLEVSDTGCGMDGDTLARIFDPFFTTKFAGRGLGLSAALGIVRGHKGAIIVDSEPGRGTTIRVLFPALERPVQPSEGASAAPAELHQGTGVILLVDDEETVRAVAKRMLEKAGFTVLSAEHGPGALELFRRRPDEIDCVLLDLTMPHMDGGETFRALRAIRDDVPVILSSGYEKGEIVERFEGAGFAAFLQKPYHYDELVSALRRVLGL